MILQPGYEAKVLWADIADQYYNVPVLYNYTETKNAVETLKEGKNMNVFRQSTFSWSLR